MSEPQLVDSRLAGSSPSLGDTSAPEWISAHLFYQGDLDQLLIQLVEPLVGALIADGRATGSFFLRYWEGGNHVRLRVRVPDPDDRDRVRADIAAAAQAFFRDHPSVDVMGSGDYAELAQALASGERVPDYARTLYPNNSLAFIDYHREYNRYPPGGSIAAVETHFVESSRLALAYLAARPTRGRRDTLAYSMILTTWFMVLAEVSEQVAWASSLLRVWERGGHALFTTDVSDYGARYERRRASLTEGAARLRARVVAGATANPDPDPFTDWTRSLQRLRDVLVVETQAGRVPPTQHAFGAVPGPAGTVQARVMPTMDICAHLMCNRLGVSIPEEYYLRYLAARATADIAEDSR
jgi:hypothetical protein